MLRPAVEVVAAAYVSYVTGGFVGFEVGAATGSETAAVVAMGAVAGAETSLITTGSFQGWQYNALSAVGFYEVGGLNQTMGWSPGSPQATFDHALVGGSVSRLSGGSFKEGFLSGGFSEAAIPYMDTNQVVAGTTESAIVGGTASVLGGGKFENGAVTGAFGYLFNDCEHNTHCLNPGGRHEGYADVPDGHGNYMWVPPGAAGGAAAGVSVDGNMLPIDASSLTEEQVSTGVGVVADAVILRCPECASGQVAGLVGTTAAVATAWDYHHPGMAIPTTAGYMVTTYLNHLGVPSTFSERAGVVISNIFEWLH